MYIEDYHYLKDLLGGYFHQDAYSEGETDEDIMRNFRKTSWDYQRLGLKADIRRFLHQHGDELLAAWEQAFAPVISIGSTNEEARDWLLSLEKMADESPSS